MVRHLQPNFLASRTAYELAVRYWRELCEGILAENYQTETWRPWMKAVFADGTHMVDGNPIYTMVSDAQKKGLRIIQKRPENAELYIIAWMQKAEGVSPNDVDELVIVCELSEESALVGKRLIQAWVNASTTYEDMKVVIAEIIPGEN